MARATIDLGIDLGTTNSAAATFNGQGAEIIRVDDSDYLPSVVFIKGGASRVGKRAYDALWNPRNSGDVHFAFKRLMGSQTPLKFESSGVGLTPEQVAAEVLKVISAAAEERLGERLRSAVITIPAWFESVQREATLRAGNSAGFDEVLLLQEPVAAALGYGFGLAGAGSERWLVFDLGGGTLDVALVECSDGELRVADHDGDNYLGGTDLDWLILESLVLPKLSRNHRVPPFSRDSGFWRVLKPRAEEAKIALSRETSACIDPDGAVSDLDGNEIFTTVELTREEYETLVSGWIDKAIEHASSLLKRNSLASSQVDRMLLVGGPTKTPLLRRRIMERLGIPVEIQNIDPMTVVARGAAVFAGGKRTSVSATSSMPGSAVSLDLEYKPITADLDPMVAGKIAGDSSVAAIELSSAGWSSGRLLLIGGTFMTRVAVMPGKLNVFSISAFDEIGNSLQIEPSTFTISHGLEAAPARLPMSYKLPVVEGYGNNETVKMETVIDKGTALPATASKSYRTRKAIKAGSNEDVLRIIVAEGEYENADSNRRVGELQINGHDIPQNLPEDVDITVTLSVDTNGIPTASAYIEYIEKHFKAILGGKQMLAVDPMRLQAEVEEERSRVRSLMSELDAVDDPSARQTLVQSSEDVLMDLQKLSGQLQSGATDTDDARQQADRERRDLTDRIDALARDVEFPKTVAEFRQIVGWARDRLSLCGTPEDDAVLEALIAEGEEAIGDGNLSRLREKKDDIIGRTYQALFRQPNFWISAFQELAAEQQLFTDRRKAELLLQQGRSALTRQDVDQLRGVVVQLWDLCPEQEGAKRAASRRYSDTGLRKA